MRLGPRVVADGMWWPYLNLYTLHRKV
jgi:hypothetical protein